MSATERLRELLDERGIEWTDRSPHPRKRQYITDWNRGGIMFNVVETHDGKLGLEADYHCLMTPEQVIDVACELTNDTTLGNDGVGRTNDGVAGHGTRYERMFGTPERAARTLADLQTCSLGFDLECDECAVYLLCHEVGACHDRDALLEWLRGDAE